MKKLGYFLHLKVQLILIFFNLWVLYNIFFLLFKLVTVCQPSWQIVRYIFYSFVHIAVQFATLSFIYMYIYIWMHL